MSGWLSRLRSTFVVAEPAGAGSGSPDDGASDADETLRRFETVVPARYESGGPPNLPTAPTPADSPADSQGKVERLKTLLDEFNQVDVHAWLVQRAVQHQEEVDSEKMMALLRQQDDAFAAQLEDAKAEVEARIVVRMREEQDELAARHREDLQQLEASYAQEASTTRAADQEAAQRYAEQHIATASAQMASDHSKAMLDERAEQGGRVNALALDVEALHGVMSHDVQYKVTSHAVHQLSAALLSIDEALGGRVHKQHMAAHCRALPALAKQLDDPLLNEAFEAADLEKTTMPVPTLAQLASRFEDVAAAGRRAALVPAGSGLWGYALASVVSSITLKASAEAVGGEASVVFATAEKLLAEGALLQAATEVKKLRGPPAATCAGWLRSAEERLLLEQTLRLAKAQASLGISSMC